MKDALFLALIVLAFVLFWAFSIVKKDTSAIENVQKVRNAFVIDSINAESKKLQLLLDLEKIKKENCLNDHLIIEVKK